MPELDKVESELRLTCRLPAAELRARRAEVAVLMEQATAATEVSNGVELQFAAAPEMAHALVDFILFERVCCPGITYELLSQPGQSSLTLRLTGPPEQLAAVHSLFLPRQ